LTELPDLGEAVELTEVPFHAQEAHHCGPASLLTVLQASGVPVEYPSIVERVYIPGLEGALAAEMSAAARHFGRLAYPLPPEPDAVLAEVAAGRPVLVLLNLGLPSRPHWHYAVVVGFVPTANRILMRSGADQRLARKAPGWLRQWDWAGRWALVLLRPGEWPVAADRDRMLRALADFEDAADPASAQRAWASAAEHWPRERSVWLGAGNTAYALADLAAAEDAYRRALELDPTYVPARLNLASALGEAGRACAGLAELSFGVPADHPLSEAFEGVQQALRAQCSEP
jgi:tetratricopeptide (TPR) repeat protein